MKKIIYIILALGLLGCSKNPLIITPEEEEKFNLEVIYLDETEPVIEFLNSAQTGLLTSEMMGPGGLVVLSYYQFVDDFGNRYDTTLAYALFRDMSSPPINMGRWRERKGLDLGDVYLENIKLEKSTREMRTPQQHHARMDTSYGVEYKLKITNFDFKHSKNHKFKIINKTGLEQNFELNTPDKKEFESLPEYDGKNLKLKFKSKTDSLNIIVNIPLSTQDKFVTKPVMMLKFKNLSDSKIKIDSTIINLIPSEYRRNYLIFSIVQERKSDINILGYPGNVKGFVSSTLYFKVNLR
ncbi:hypothetical protein JGI3_01674 [Candidatus Kryptobacter tengchongensis]|uniref:Uncharacterized protein n=1 Tax=Kryptobacter tengchongensis TaxID=1643429 RepID=A0A656D589_KRYT1|nr:hypothetical protein [Candidatus Kryptobacter tengchongensis]CUS99924.1 hypothetical protein JGI24_00689 [Candidatus Kryptobacter tengchongensis]CUU08342.1 hypothetical protein JGI3_01674 [Candidatus Kryptobacter tengchongensis]